MFSKSTPSSLSDEDKAYICEQIGQAVSCLAYADSDELGDLTASNLEALPENTRFGLKFSAQVG
ncbi:MAG: hypothetical protein EOO40_01690 [Deltaproteobacteria bacterium]|nr:MAG: hypothetical protein EOO40_01690 [Deltaproteobacteria bacterium]